MAILRFPRKARQPAAALLASRGLVNGSRDMKVLFLNDFEQQHSTLSTSGF